MAEEEVKEEQAQAQTEGEAKPAASGDKVPLKERFIAGAIDGVIANVAGVVAGMVLGFASSFLAVVGTSAAMGIYYLVKDSILGNGQSPGKKIMKFQVLGPDNQPCTQALSIKRNLPLAIGPLVGAVLGVFYFIPVINFLAAFASIFAYLGYFGITLAESYFIYSDPKGIRYGDKYAGTYTKML